MLIWKISPCHRSVENQYNLLQVYSLHSKQVYTAVFTMVRQHSTADRVWYSSRCPGSNIHDLLAKWRTDFMSLLWLPTSDSSDIPNSWGEGTWTGSLLLLTLEASSNDASHLLLPGITCKNKVFPSRATGTWWCGTTFTTKLQYQVCWSAVQWSSHQQFSEISLLKDLKTTLNMLAYQANETGKYDILSIFRIFILHLISLGL